jgi:Mycothiol maleylpyruvate isomerase N-terminal domain
VLSRASASDLARPGPCADWTLADLLAHMTAQHNGSAAAAAGDARISSAGQQGRQRLTL